MDVTPHISIIIPTFNSARTLGACLDSIVSQTYKNYEVIIMDGESKDDTLHIVKSYEPRLSQALCISGKDNGIYDAMNKAISLAKGQWLYFLGSDDLLFDGRVLEKISVILRPDAVMVYGKAFITPNNTVTEGDYNFEKLMKWNICHQAIFYSKNVFKKWRYDLKFPTLADWDLNLKIFSSHDPKHIVGYGDIVCTFNNTGISSEWYSGTEYLKNFSSPLEIILRYQKFPRSLRVILSYLRKNGMQKLIRMKLP